EPINRKRSPHHDRAQVVEHAHDPTRVRDIDAAPGAVKRAWCDGPYGIAKGKVAIVGDKGAWRDGPHGVAKAKAAIVDEAVGEGHGAGAKQQTARIIDTLKTYESSVGIG